MSLPFSLAAHPHAEHGRQRVVEARNPSLLRLRQWHVVDVRVADEYVALEFHEF